ncbi:MAG: ThiF family adenylyltransferase [Acidobacteria bacterium]|nr:ThiF family adenylyltransferase [Acidobacteriota bacterium]
MTPFEREKYSRQILFPPLGEEGQERLLRSRAVIVGCGALGSLEANALARAGVGEIVLIDRDYIEPSNLQRQWLFDEADAAEGLPKAVAAARKLAAINSSVTVRGVVADLTPQNAEDLLLPAGVILDGTDNFDTRYLMNDVAVKHGVAWIYGAAVGSYGLTMPILPGASACLACLFPAPPAGPQPTCDTAGILNAITALIASLQVADALKILAGKCEEVEPRLFTADVWKNTYRTVSTRERHPDCPACGRREFAHLEGRDRPPISLCGRNAVQIHERARPIDLRALAETLGRLGTVRANEFALRFFCPPYEMTVFPDGRAIIKGTDDPGVARSLYARYVGA